MCRVDLRVGLLWLFATESGGKLGFVPDEAIDLIFGRSGRRILLEL